MSQRIETVHDVDSAKINAGARAPRDLWVKVPGESDGSCTRGTGGPVDPERGVVGPPAGVWWPDQVHQLAALADPAPPSAILAKST